MNIAFLVMFTMFMSHASSTAISGEDLMRSILRKVMTCPKAEDHYIINEPVAAFSPARYMQLVAIVRKDSGEFSCGKKKQYPFHINDPRSWNFCGMGICLSGECACFKSFKGDNCSKFEGRCWLFYCYLKGCKFEPLSLQCVCDPSLYGTTVSSGIYFYDTGIDDHYRVPPRDYTTTDLLEGPIIREESIGRYVVIGGNYNSPSSNAAALKRHNYANIYTRQVPGVFYSTFEENASPRRQENRDERYFVKSRMKKMFPVYEEEYKRLPSEEKSSQNNQIESDMVFGRSVHKPRDYPFTQKGKIDYLELLNFPYTKRRVHPYEEKEKSRSRILPRNQEPAFVRYRDIYTPNGKLQTENQWLKENQLLPRKRASILYQKPNYLYAVYSAEENRQGRSEHSTEKVFWSDSEKDSEQQDASCRMLKKRIKQLAEQL